MEADTRDLFYFDRLYDVTKSAGRKTFMGVNLIYRDVRCLLAYIFYMPVKKRESI